MTFFGDFLKMSGAVTTAPRRLVFGVPLDHSQNELPEVLLLIGQCFAEKGYNNRAQKRYVNLNVLLPDLYKLEGIFRIPANQNEIQMLQAQFDKGRITPRPTKHSPSLIKGF